MTYQIPIDFYIVGEPILITSKKFFYLKLKFTGPLHSSFKSTKGATYLLKIRSSIYRQY